MPPCKPSPSVTVNKTTSLGWTDLSAEELKRFHDCYGTAAPAIADYLGKPELRTPSIDLHDLQPSFSDSVPAMFGIDTLDHLPERKAEISRRSKKLAAMVDQMEGTIHAEPPPSRNAFGLPVSIFEGDFVRSTRTGRTAQVTRLRPYGLLDVQTLPEHEYECWTASACEAVPAHTAVPVGKSPTQPVKAPRPLFFQRTEREPFSFEEFFGPLCIVAFMVGLFGATIASKVTCAVGLVATVVFGVLGLRKT
jgi:hypothetical protein